MSLPTTKTLWRPAAHSDHATIVQLSLALYAQDPGDAPVPQHHTQRTLIAFVERPERGRAVVLEVDRVVCGYALLVAFWSNELGGEACVIDELYVDHAQRGRGYATQLIAQLAAHDARHVALMLEVTPSNVGAHALYARLGFAGKNLSLRRRLRT